MGWVVMRVHFLLATVTFATACGGADSSITVPPHTVTNKTVDVFTVNTVFVDALDTISRGDTVRWNFAVAADDGKGHNVRFNPPVSGSPADIGTVANPLKTGTVSRVFATSGDFHYVCDLHGGMLGEIVVK